MKSDDKMAVWLAAFIALIVIAIATGGTLNAMTNSKTKREQVKTCVVHGGSWTTNSEGWPECRR